MLMVRMGLDTAETAEAVVCVALHPRNLYSNHNENYRL